MNQTIESIMNRRSCRSYRPDPIDDDIIHMIIEAGMYAPSAGNRQPWHFTVILDGKLLEELSLAAKEAAKGAGVYLAHLANTEKFHAFHHAPAAVIVSGRENALLPQVDCAAATQNMLVAAESLGIGACWVGFIIPLLVGETQDEYKRKLGIPEGYKPYYGIALGYKAGTSPTPKRKGTVNYIE